MKKQGNVSSRSQSRSGFADSAPRRGNTLGNRNRHNFRREQIVSTNEFSPTTSVPSSSAAGTWLHKFFYPKSQATEEVHASNDQARVKYAARHMNVEISQYPKHDASASTDDQPSEQVARTSDNNANSPVQVIFEENPGKHDEDDRLFVHNFWRTYDDIIVLALFTQIGIVFRLAMSTWFTYFDGVFSADSALFVNLPLNSLSCFLMGILCSGDRLMEIITTRFTPPHLQLDIFHLKQESESFEDDNNALLDEQTRQKVLQLRRSRAPRRKKRQRTYFHSWQPPVQLNQELRDVQLLALERRIRASKCLLLFPVKKEDVDVVEDYFRGGYKRDDDEDTNSTELQDLRLFEDNDDAVTNRRCKLSLTADVADHSVSDSPLVLTNRGTSPNPRAEPLETLENGQKEDSDDEQEASRAETAQTDATIDQSNDLDQIIQDVQANVSENILRLRRANIADGWDVGTTASEMSDDLLLGLRDGFCGALSSFSSWNSAMVNLMKNGEIGQSFVGYMLGLQLPIIAYRFGQHMSVYIFIWRCRQEARGDAKRGYGIRVDQSDSDNENEAGNDEAGGWASREETPGVSTDRDTPSVRAILTAILIMALVTQCTSLSFFNNPDNQQLALSLLFSPLGVYARWRLSKLNCWKPTFPVGTFIANILACALSGSLGSLLAGDPGPKTRIVLVSIIAGFGGTLSSLSAFITEILAGIDPVLLRIDGVVYAAIAIVSAMLVGFVFSATADWADKTQ